MDNPKLINLSRVKQVVNEFLRQQNPDSTIPVPIEEIVELKLNIRVILISGLIRDFGVNAFISQSFDTIVIDEQMFMRQPERIRFTLAEEIGHLFLHKDWYLSNGPKGIEDYLSWQEKLDGELFSYIERQAKTFASMVLMPEEIIMEKWIDFSTKHGLPKNCNVYDLPDNTLPELAHEFAVSTESLLMRLNFLKLLQIPDGFWDKVKRR